MTLANVHSIETFGSVDGPGLRYILFFIMQIHGISTVMISAAQIKSWITQKDIAAIGEVKVELPSVAANLFFKLIF